MRSKMLKVAFRGVQLLFFSLPIVAFAIFMSGQDPAHGLKASPTPPANIEKCDKTTVTPQGTPMIKDAKLSAVAASEWGAVGASMNVEENAVKFEFDCAEGEIREPLMADEKGNFKASGFYMRHPFGPIRLNNLPKFEPAIYEGKITGDQMSFGITLEGADEVLIEFTVERGRQPRLHRCY